MINILKVSSMSPGVTKGQMAYHCCKDMHIGGWSHLWIHAKSSVGQFKVKWLTIVVQT